MYKFQLVKKIDVLGLVLVNIYVSVIVFGLNLLSYIVMIYFYDNLINFLVYLR